jgi:curved DNA-binding protein CbpA
VNFDPEKDYYGILGVTASAEMAVIKAAYKALAGIYHPDRNPTPNAKEKMQAINEAWSVLSNSDTRKKYDEALSQREPHGNFHTEDDQEDTIRSYFEKDWTFALSYYPNLDTLANRLEKISRRLGVAYKAILVTEKSFKDAGEIAKKMEREFLERYFGSNQKIQAIVSILIFDLNDKSLLRELNHTISILGTKDPDPIIQKFRREIDRERKSRLDAWAKARGVEQKVDIANYRFEKRQILSGKYQVDLRKSHRKLKHKSVTIDFEGGAFSWSISHLDKKALTEAYWEALPDEEQIGINLAINNWANDLYEKHGMKPTG